MSDPVCDVSSPPVSPDFSTLLNEAATFFSCSDLVDVPDLAMAIRKEIKREEAKDDDADSRKLEQLADLQARTRQLNVAANGHFSHLHVHSDFSLLDGACRVDRLCEKVWDLGQGAVAVTDHGNMFAALDFHTAAKKAGVNSVIGCEFYVAPKGIADHSDNTRHHLVLLAKSYEGYQSLCRLNAAAWSDEGFYYKARVDRDLLRKHRNGLICLSACVAGEIQSHVLNNRMDAAREAVEFFIDVFGKDDFFLEIQYHGEPGQKPEDCERSDQRDLLEMEHKVNQAFLALSQEYGVGLVATNDAHYLAKSDYEAHDALLCVGTQSNLSDAKRLRFSGDQFYVKSTREMEALFAAYPGAVDNSKKIADRCSVDMPLWVNHYPVYRLDDERDDPADAHCPVRRKKLRDVCIENLPKRYNVLEADNPDYVPRGDDEPDAAFRKDILDRMEFELKTIDDMGYISYFLVVWDFINHARRQGIPVGPGRGSGAGSIVAYLTGITDLDPLRYGLLFERFLNPDRVSPPDFDIDFCERRRGEVIDYVRDKYGAPSVAQIGTFGTLKAKAVLKDVARVMGVPFADSNKLVALIPTDPKMTLEKALTMREVKARYDSEEWVREVFDRAKILEGLNRNQSIHACGVIIGDQKLENVVPLARGAGKEWITQFPAGPCESLGLLKMDFLGLKTLTIIQDTIEMVNERTGRGLTPDDIPLDDAKTYELLNRGATVAVFQLESSGMQDLCRSFKISKLEEIIALVALYRPGPMEFIPTFINCKLGRETPEYETPEMRELLSETYGIMVYQEQIMQVVQAVAGFSLAQADIMRRAIGKKKESVLREQGEKFKEGCLEQGVAADVADSIWRKILKFASYGFNKSHSACYGLMSYRTAYLKANYPAEFMAAVLNGELNNADKLSLYISEAEDMGLDISPPDINGSALRFGVADGNVLFGLSAIKGMGESAANAMIQARQDGGPFKNLSDFCERVGSKVNKRVMESLCKAGAFDGFGLKRSQIFSMIEPAVSRAAQTIRDREMGQGNLFDLLDDSVVAGTDDLPVPDVPEWSMQELLRNEKELLGFYVTGHPIDQYADQLKILQTDRLEAIPEMENDFGTRVGGFLAGVVIKRRKKDDRAWAILNLESRAGSVECLCFPDTFDAVAAALVPGAPVLVEGHVSKREEEPVKFMVAQVLTLEAASERLVTEVYVRLRETEFSRDTAAAVMALCQRHPGKTEMIVSAVCESGDTAFVKLPVTIAVTADFRAGLADLVGEDAIHQKADQTRPAARKRQKWDKNRQARDERT
ncbi:MAG: DNA polymerase III subunit alpha [Lentisphaeria bacterium]|nr:DNA polymerase III subunit alpha [Lentisphaeria bacterium]